MLLDRHRLLRLIELAELELRVIGPERMLREEDVALLVKAAYDDATDLARAEFLARVKPIPTSAWPWSAVQAMTPRSNARNTHVLYSPAPGALAPAALMLLRGQADGIDADPGNRIPDRGQPDAGTWEPLHKALDLWDTATIKKWVGPQGWVAGGMAASQAPPKPGGLGGQPNGGQSNGGAQPNAGQPNGGYTETPPAAMPFSWRHPAVMATGATVATTVGITLYALRHRHRPALASSPPTAVQPGASAGSRASSTEEPT